MLKVENLQYGYPGGPEVLKDISFTLGEGQFMAILVITEREKARC